MAMVSARTTQKTDVAILLGRVPHTTEMRSIVENVGEVRSDSEKATLENLPGPWLPLLKKR